MLSLYQNGLSLGCFLRLLYSLGHHLSLLLPLVIVVIGLFLFLLAKLCNLLLFRHHFIKSLNLLLLESPSSLRRVDIFDLLNPSIETLRLVSYLLILPVLGPLLAHFQFDLQGVELLNDGLICGRLVVLVSKLGRLLLLHELALTHRRLTIFNLKLLAPALLKFLHVCLERLHRLELETSLLAFYFVEGLLAFLVEKIRFLDTLLHSILDLLLRQILSLLSL